MSHWQDDYEPSARLHKERGMKIEIEGSAQVQEAILSALSAHFASDVDAQVKDAITEAVRNAVDAQVKALCQETIRPLIVEAIEAGWQRTNNYGEPIQGSRIGVKERIGDMLNARDNYSQRGSWIERIATEVIEKELKAEFGKVIEDAKARLRKQFDDEVQGRFLKVVREGLGLKP